MFSFAPGPHFHINCHTPLPWNDWIQFFRLFFWHRVTPLSPIPWLQIGSLAVFPALGPYYVSGPEPGRPMSVLRSLCFWTIVKFILFIFFSPLISFLCIVSLHILLFCVHSPDRRLRAWIIASSGWAVTYSSPVFIFKIPLIFILLYFYGLPSNFPLEVKWNTDKLFIYLNVL